MKPLNDFIILNPLKEEVKIGGLEMTEELKRGDRYGLAQVEKLPEVAKSLLNEGDTVYYERSGSFTLNLKGRPVTMAKLKQIVLVV